MAEELRELSEEELDEMLSVSLLADDGGDTGDPSVFTLFSGVYETPLLNGWRNPDLDGEQTCRFMLTCTNDVVFLHSLDGVDAVSGSFCEVPEGLAPSFPVQLSVSTTGGFPCELRIDAGGMKCTMYGEGAVVPANGLSFNICDVWYLND